MDESYFGGRRKGNRGWRATGKIPVFGILERRGKVQVGVVQNVTVKLFSQWPSRKWNAEVSFTPINSVVNNALISYGSCHMRNDNGKRFVNGKVSLNGIERFWSFAKERLRNITAPRNFPLFLKELEIRYNHRQHDLYDDLVKCIYEYFRVASIQ